MILFIRKILKRILLIRMNPDDDPFDQDISLKISFNRAVSAVWTVDKSESHSKILSV